jgi:hypothetical protein
MDLGDWDATRGVGEMRLEEREQIGERRDWRAGRAAGGYAGRVENTTVKKTSATTKNTQR